MVNIYHENDQPVVVAVRLRYSQRHSPWVETTGIVLTETGKRLFGNSLPLANMTFDLLCADGLGFVACRAERSHGSHAPVKFVALHAVDETAHLS